MSPETLNLIRVSQDHQIKPFDCDDADLNEFLFKDAKRALSQNIAVTYLLERNDTTAAYFSLLNDKISLKEVRRESFENIKASFLHTGFDNLQSFPAVKIGRLGVDLSSQGQGMGKWIFNYLKVLFLDKNRTGCRFITVDAYARSLTFYEKLGFSFMTQKDEGKLTRLMYFDLQKV